MRILKIIAVGPILVLLIAAIGCNDSSEPGGDKTSDTPPEPRGEKITLKLQLQKGDIRKLAHDFDMNRRVSTQGQEIEMRMQMGSRIGVVVEDVDDAGLHTIKMTYDRIKFKISQGPMTVDYDSDKPSEDADPAISR